MGFLRLDLLNILISIPAIIIAFVAQGYAKALVADRLGDKTPRFNGRVTLNPAAHLDPVGFLMILILGFGFTKPVQTNPRAYKRGYKDSIKVSIAPPLANFIVAFIAIILNTILIKVFPVFSGATYTTLMSMLLSIATVNIGLGVFTLIPLPGLAGFDIFRDIAPKKFNEVSNTLYQYQMVIILGIILLGGNLLAYIRVFLLGIFQIVANSILFFL